MELKKTKMNQCYFCNSPDLETISKYFNRVTKSYTVCKNCGFGFGNTGQESKENFDENLAIQVKAIKLLKALFPNDTSKQLHDRYSFHQHRVEDHPVVKGGYCEFCEVNWLTMSSQEFKERLGYDKSKWIKESEVKKKWD